MFSMIMILFPLALALIGRVGIVFIVEEIKRDLVEKQAECQEGNQYSTNSPFSHNCLYVTKIEQRAICATGLQLYPENGLLRCQLRFVRNVMIQFFRSI